MLIKRFALKGILSAAVIAAGATPAVAASCDTEGNWRGDMYEGMPFVFRILVNEKTPSEQWDAVVDDERRSLDGDWSNVFIAEHKMQEWKEVGARNRIFDQLVYIDLEHPAINEGYRCWVRYEVRDKENAAGNRFVVGRFVSHGCANPGDINLEVDCERNFRTGKKRMTVRITLRNLD